MEIPDVKNCKKKKKKERRIITLHASLLAVFLPLYLNLNVSFQFSFKWDKHQWVTSMGSAAFGEN